MRAHHGLLNSACKAREADMTASLPVPPDVRNTLLNDGWFRDCPAPFQDALIAYARCHRLAAGEHLFERGMKDGDLYCILSGSLCVQASDVEGETPVLTQYCSFMA
jgi:hypothetical protein